jgi:glycosyltransferase involved in cell wall biosynthesis
MRINIINNTSFYDKGMSGSDRRAIEWSKSWIKRGFDVHVFGHRDIEKRYYRNNSKITYHALSNYNSNSIVKNVLYSTIRGILNFREIKNADIIYSSSDLMGDSIPGFFAKLMNRRAKWIAGLHLIAPNPWLGFNNIYTGKKKGLALNNTLYFVIQRFVINLYHRCSDLVMISNKIDREFLLGQGFKEGKMIVTHGGISMKEIPKNKQKKIYDSCFVGRFHAQKGLDDLLYIWHKICKKNKKASLIIVGEGDMLMELKSKVRNLGIEKNVKFAGFVDGKRKYKIIKSSKIFLFPSTYESFGMSALEAMACGVPVLAYDLPIYREIFTMGMVKVPVSDKETFFEKLDFLLENKKERDRLSHEAMDLASRFSWEKTSKLIFEKLM